MGCLSSKITWLKRRRKRILLIEARYAIPLWLLLKVNNVSDEKVNDFKEAFKKVDKSNTGIVSSKEIDHLMKATKHIEDTKEIQDLMAKAGVRDMDAVDFEMFMKMVLGYTRRLDPEIEVKEAFSIIDTNQDGFINSWELRDLFQNLGDRLTDAEVAALIRKADFNDDGQVDYNEFIRLLCNPGDVEF